MTVATDFCPKCRFDSDQGHDEVCPEYLAAQQGQAEVEALAERARLDAEAWARVEAQFYRTDESRVSWTCKDCGNIVGDRQIHVDWHEELDRRISRASRAYINY